MNQKQSKNKHVMSTVIAGVTGAVAGVAVATGIALTDEKNREKAKEVMADIKDKAMDYVANVKSEPAVEKGTDMVKKVADDAKKLLKKTI